MGIVPSTAIPTRNGASSLFVVSPSTSEAFSLLPYSLMYLSRLSNSLFTCIEGVKVFCRSPSFENHIKFIVIHDQQSFLFVGQPLPTFACLSSD